MQGYWARWAPPRQRPRPRGALPCGAWAWALGDRGPTAQCASVSGSAGNITESQQHATCICWFEAFVRGPGEQPSREDWGREPRPLRGGDPPKSSQLPLPPLGDHRLQPTSKPVLAPPGPGGCFKQRNEFCLLIQSQKNIEPAQITLAWAFETREPRSGWRPGPRREEHNTNLSTMETPPHC